MLCKANVHLSDWPLDGLRDVDPKDEKIKGLLRSGFIVAMVPREPAKPKAKKPADKEAADG